MMDIEPVENTASERASEGASERNCMVRTPPVAQTEATKQKNTTVGCEHQKQRKQKQQNRNNTHNREFSFHVIRCHFGPLLSALVFAPPSCIDARTLYLSRHLASVFAPCMLPLQLAPYLCAIPHARRFRHHEDERRNCCHCRHYEMGANP